MQKANRASRNPWIFWIFIIAAVLILYFLRSVVAIVLFAMLLAALVDPVATKLQQWKIPRWLSVAFVYIVLLAGMTGLIVLVAPTLVQQTHEVLTTYAPYIEEATGGLVNVGSFLSGDVFEQDFSEVVTTLKNSGVLDAVPEMISVLSDVFGGVVTLVVIFILAFYIIIEEKTLLSGLESALPKRYKTFTDELVPAWREKVGSWVRGQLLIMFLVGLMTYIIFTILGVPYALMLAIVAGLLEIVPFIGPILTGLFAIVISLSVSPLIAVLVAIFSFVIQQIEAEFLTPKIMQKVVGLNPVIVIIAVLVGFEVGGPVGAMLAVPFTMSVAVFVKEWTSMSVGRSNR